MDKPLHAFGSGLSYTKFEVSDVSITVLHEDGQQACHDDGTHSFTVGSVVIVKASVHNSGNRKGGWPVFVKVQDDACIVPPAGPMLKRFLRVQLAPGESSALQFTVRQHSDHLLRTSAGKHVMHGHQSMCRHHPYAVLTM